jgi:hypothetical protein
VEFVFANILIFVIDMPLLGRIFSTCFWTSCVGTVIMMVSSMLGMCYIICMSSGSMLRETCHIFRWFFSIWFFPMVFYFWLRN